MIVLECKTETNLNPNLAAKEIKPSISIARSLFARLINFIFTVFQLKRQHLFLFPIVNKTRAKVFEMEGLLLISLVC